jgi:diguanylate cyclase (GGDEF)-like protein
MDLHTLHIEHVVLLGVFTILTLINCYLHRGTKGIYWFPAFTLCAFMGALLVALRGHISDAVSIVFGMMFFHVAYFVLHRGLVEFLDHVKYRWTIYLQSAAVFIAGLGMLEYGFIHPDTGRRAVFYSAVFAFQTGLTAWMMFRHIRRAPGIVMGSILGLLAVNNVVRATVAMMGGLPANYQQVGLSLQISLLETTVLQSGIVAAFLWMTAERLHSRLDRLASTDSLTGLLNRRALEMAAEREIALSRKSMRPLTALLIDLDRFKQINDSYGHSFGDHTLQKVARCLEDHMRKCDLLARVGGDEFAVMLQNTSREEAMVIAERLRAALEELMVVDGEIEARVSASIGLAEADEITEDWSELIRRCDKALYEVKQTGGNLALAS